MWHPGEADGVSSRALGSPWEGAGTAGATVHTAEAPSPLLAAQNLLSTPPEFNCYLAGRPDLVSREQAL